MKRTFALLQSEQRIQNREPSYQRKISSDNEGNELWVRVYQEPDGYCIATVLVRFPKKDIEVEMSYDKGTPDEGVNPLEACVKGVKGIWGIKHFFDFA